MDTNPLDLLVSEIFSIKVADTDADTSTDNKGRLNLAGREPTADRRTRFSAFCGS